MPICAGIVGIAIAETAGPQLYLVQMLLSHWQASAAPEKRFSLFCLCKQIPEEWLATPLSTPYPRSHCHAYKVPHSSIVFIVFMVSSKS